MPWVPIQESDVTFNLTGASSITDSIVSFSSPTEAGDWFMVFTSGVPVSVRVTALAYTGFSELGVSFPAKFQWWEGATTIDLDNTDPTHTSFLPSPFEAAIDGVNAEYLSYSGAAGLEWSVAETYQFLIEVFVAESTPEYLVYELDRGWSFDGNYIPCYLELNWYFGDTPVNYRSIQKVRIHGMSRGRALLSLSVNGMQTDYLPIDYTEPQIIDLPRNPRLVDVQLQPTTNYTDTANRGIAIQMKFEGRNTDITMPEPQHVLQVLVVQSSPQGTGHRAN